MGQKSNPIGLRLQINRTWDSRWYAEGDSYARLLLEDLKIRKFIMKALPQAAISKVVIERPAKLCRVSIYAARPGVIIGKKGSDIEKLRKQLGSMTSSDVSLNIVEIRKPEIDARLVAQGIADQLERRIAFRRAMKRAVQSSMRLGAEGIRVVCGGRLGGAEIARTKAIARAGCRCTRCAPTSIMPKPRPTPPTGCAASRSGSSRAKSRPRSDVAGPPHDGGPDLRRAPRAR
jgi:small subunit ribosomal protein S3